MLIVSHKLRVRHLEASLAFYQSVLGMKLVDRRDKATESGVVQSHYFLSFKHSSADLAGHHPFELLCARDDAYLELIYSDGDFQDFYISPQPNMAQGYWKFAVAVQDLDYAVAQLRKKGVTLGTPFEVPDVAYLCHLTDPNGYCIELIQHDFKVNTLPIKQNDLVSFPIGGRACLSLSTVRVKDPNVSVAFYQNMLAMKLLSRQEVAERKMTLYFLACTEDVLLDSDIDSVHNREWLWKRPYTLLELQHVWGTETDGDFSYQVGADTGFSGLDLRSRNLMPVIRACEHYDTEYSLNEGGILEPENVSLYDPDGFKLRVMKLGTV